MFGCVLQMVMVILANPAVAQTDQNQPNDGSVNPRFAAMTKEIAAVCGPFLPNQIPGITEIMSLCGGRFAFRLGRNTMLESQLITGAGSAQTYSLGSISFRGDVQIDEIIASYYAGADVHDVTSPVFNSGAATTSANNIYFGAHVGGALWWDISDVFATRVDLQFMFNPGTSLFLGFSLVLRFDPQDQQQGASQ